MEGMRLVLLVAIGIGCVYCEVYAPRLVSTLTDEAIVTKSQILANTTYYYDNVYAWLAEKSENGFSFADIPHLETIGDLMVDFCETLIVDAEMNYESLFAATLASEKIMRYIDYMIPQNLKVRPKRDAEYLEDDAVNRVARDDATETAAAPASTPISDLAPDTTTGATPSVSDITTGATSMTSDTTTVVTEGITNATPSAPDTTTGATPSAPDTTTGATPSAPDTTTGAIPSAPNTTIGATTIAPDTTTATLETQPTLSSPTSRHTDTTATTTPTENLTTTATSSTTTSDSTDTNTTDSTEEIVDPDDPEGSGSEDIEQFGFWRALYKLEKKRNTLLLKEANAAKKSVDDIYAKRNTMREAMKTMNEKKELQTFLHAVEDIGTEIRDALIWSLKSYNDLHYFSTMMDSSFYPRRNEARSGLRVKLINARYNLPNLLTGSFYPVSFTQKVTFFDEDIRCNETSDNYEICPISYLKQHKLLTFEITRNELGFMQFAQGERVRLDSLEVVMRGIIDGGSNITVEVMNVGEFSDYYKSDTYKFFGGPVKVEARFDVTRNRHQIPRGVHDQDERYRAVTTPYTHWILALDMEKNDPNLDLTHLRAVEIHFKGSANYAFIHNND